jgi:hypothetical protein
MDYTKLTKHQLLEKCRELGIEKCKSKNKTELIALIETQNEHTKDVHDYIPYDDDDIDYLCDRNFSDIMTDTVEWSLYPKPLLHIIDSQCKSMIVLAQKMKHTLRSHYDYHRVTSGVKSTKRQIVYKKLLYKYIYDHKLCLDNFH